MDAAARRLLTISLAFGLLTSCGQRPSPARQAPPKTPRGDVAEVEALVAATRQHPSLVNGQNAGPPIHVDPYPHSRGAPSRPHATK